MADSSLPISSIKLHCKFNEISNVHLVVSRRRIKCLIDWLASFLLYNVRLSTLSWPPPFLQLQPFPSTDPAINADVSAKRTEPPNLLQVLGWAVGCGRIGLTGDLFQASEPQKPQIWLNKPISLSQHNIPPVQRRLPGVLCSAGLNRFVVTWPIMLVLKHIQSSPQTAGKPQIHQIECFLIQSHQNTNFQLFVRGFVYIWMFSKCFQNVCL